MVPPKLAFAGSLCANIHWLPNNAGITFQTTNVQTCNVLTRKAQEGTSTGFCRAQLSANLLRISGGFCQFTFLCHSLCLINVIICKNEEMSRLDINSHHVAASGFIAKQPPNDWGIASGKNALATTCTLSGLENACDWQAG